MNIFGEPTIVNQEKLRRSSEAFMRGLGSQLIPDLNNLYATGNAVEYNKLLARIKKHGVSVLRNSEGKHKIRIITDDGEHYDYSV